MNNEPRQRSYYFLRTALVLVILLVGLAVGMAFTVFRTEKQDFAAYHALMLEANPTHGDKSAKQSYNATQQQHQIRKDIFFFKDMMRQHLYLTSRDINLVLDQRAGVTDLTEELTDVKCLLQQECFYGDEEGRPVAKEAPQATPWQKIYRAKAEHASFSYWDKTFKAETVSLVDFDAPGHKLSPEVESCCETQQPTSLSIEASIADYNGKTLSLKGSVRLTHPQGSMAADEVFIEEVIRDEPGIKPKSLSSRNAVVYLKGAIEVNHKDLGTLVNNREVRVYLSESKGKREMRRIEGDGYTYLNHAEAGKHRSHHLVCEGKMVADHEKGIVTFDGSNDGKQVFFYDTLGEAQADKITVYYQKTLEGMAATKVLLEGNVYLVDHKDLDDKNEGKQEPLHYALADVVEYTPSTRELLLSANAGGRVLFYDKINRLQVSSSVLKVFRDQTTQKETIKGLGDVRFHFLEGEFEQLRKRVNLNF